MTRWPGQRRLILAIILTTCCITDVTRAQVPTFEQAYAQELEGLTATKAALNASLAAFEKTGAQHKIELEGKIKRSESKLLEFKRRVKQLEARRDLLAEKDLVTEDHQAVLRALLAESGSSQMAQAAGESPAADNLAAAFLAAVNTAAEEIDGASRMRVAPGRFFGLDGKQVQGQIIRIGEIAALGLAPDTGGILLKLEGGYRVLDESARDQAEQIAGGESPAAVDLFLFSPECTGHDPRQGNGLVGMLNKGGPVAWVISGLALLGLLLVIERLWTLSRLTNWRGRGFEPVIAKLRIDDFEAASSFAIGMGAVGRVLRGVIERRTLSREDLEKRASEIVLRAMPALQRSLTILVVITAVAPLLGLLGTVTGMISTFDVITEFGTGDPKLLSGGISEALITTKLGLAVAVPFLLIRSLIARWSDRIIENMQTYALAAINIIMGREEAADE